MPNSALNKEVIKAMFIDAYDKMIISKDEILKNLELVLNQIVSVESIEEKIIEVNSELGQVVLEVKTLIHTSLASDDINEQQLNLEAKYDTLVQKLKKLEHQKDEVIDTQNKINNFISNLRNKGYAITEFGEELFNIMIDKAVFNRDKSIEFIFNSGYKVKVEARK